MELFEFELIYEERKAIKAQVLANFKVRMTKLEGESAIQREWMLYIDGSSNRKGSGAGVILEGPNNITLEYSFRFDFQVTNNQVKYKALVVSLRLAKEVSAKTLSIKSDSQLIIP